jgi:hypothetical protein
MTTSRVSKLNDRPSKGANWIVPVHEWWGEANSRDWFVDKFKKARRRRRAFFMTKNMTLNRALRAECDSKRS